MKKIIAFIPLFLVGATTVSNGAVFVSTTDINSVGQAMLNSSTSILDTLIKFAPWLVGLVAVGIVFNFLKGLIGHHNHK